MIVQTVHLPCPTSVFQFVRNEGSEDLVMSTSSFYSKNILMIL